MKNGPVPESLLHSFVGPDLVAETWNRDTVDTEIGFVPIREQIAVLTHDHGEWVLLIDSDDDEPERAWNDLDAALEELWRDGWEVAQGSASLRPSFPEFEELDRFAPWGYRLRRIFYQLPPKCVFADDF